jgi:hypothetical protein
VDLAVEVEDAVAEAAVVVVAAGVLLASGDGVVAAATAVDSGVEVSGSFVTDSTRGVHVGVGVFSGNEV